MANTNAKVLGLAAAVAVGGLVGSRTLEMYENRKSFEADMQRCYEISLREAPTDTVKIPSGRGLEAILRQVGVDINTQFGQCVADYTLKINKERGNYNGRVFTGNLAVVPGHKHVSELKEQFKHAMDVYEKNNSFFYSTN
jgi:hypothetical protein